MISVSSGKRPWICLRHFNVILHSTKVFGVNHGPERGAVEFTNMVYSTCLEDLRYIGFYFTWSNKRTDQNQFIKKKLDRVLINQAWLDAFPMAFAEFLAPGISDQSLAVVQINPPIKKKGKPFKFYNYWATLDNFKETIAESWIQNFEGTSQF